MKLLHIIASMDPLSGGPCQVIRNTVQGLKKLGVHCEVVSLDDPKESFLSQDHFKVYALGPSRNFWRYTNKLDTWLSQNLDRFNVVIVHGLWLYHSYALNKIVRSFKKCKMVNSTKWEPPRVYIMPHGMLDPYFQLAPDRKLKAIRNEIYWALLENNVVREADGLLFTCEEELRLARTSFRSYKPKQEMNIGLGIVEPPPYCIQMQKAFRLECSFLIDKPYFLFLGRIHEKKGIDLLLKAYAELAKTLTSIKPLLVEAQNLEFNSVKTPSEYVALPKLVIAGPGVETKFGQEMQKLVQSNKSLRNAVFFPGMLSGNAKWGAFYGCEAFVLPSHQENFGIAVVEALACSKPVMITKQVNIWREILDNNGGLVAEDTLEGLEVMLKNWKKMSKQDIKSMGQQARAVFEKYYAIAPASARFLEAIQAT